ncbi:MAG: hypothetical protein ACMXYF_03565 [Candidatus Woesearchaeota archaeon]
MASLEDMFKPRHTFGRVQPIETRMSLTAKKHCEGFLKIRTGIFETRIHVTNHYTLCMGFYYEAFTLPPEIISS